MNDSVDRGREFHTYTAAMEYARDGISYTGNKVKRVQLMERNGWRPNELLRVRELWDANWTDESKDAGLRNAP
jgi:hypothetical protein